MQTPEQVQAAWKTAAIETIRTETSQMKAKAFEIIPSSVDEVAFKLIDVPTESGRTNSFVQVLTFNDVRPDFPMSISLTTPSDTFDKYVGLLGLILRDREVKWTTGDEPIEQFSRPLQEAPSFYEFAEKAVHLLANGDAGGFLTRFSENALEANGIDNARNYVQSILIPFFADFSGLGASQTNAPTSDAFGSEGYSFYLTAKTIAGDERPFVIYVVKEKGRLKIGNVVTNKTYRDLHK